MKLLSLGPVNITPKVRDIKLDNISHRSEDFKKLHNTIKLKIKNKLGHDYEVMFIPGSGTAGIEAMISSFQNKKLMVCSNGSFGEKWQMVAGLYNIDLVKYKNGWGVPFNNTEIIKIAKNNGIDTILLVHHETSVNIINSLEGFEDLNLVVDMVSSFGVEPINLKNSNILMCSFSSNKGTCCYPGISIVLGKPEYLKKLEITKPFYLNLKNYYEYSLLNQTPTTPNVSIMQYLNKSLDNLNCDPSKLVYITKEFKKLGIYEIPISNKSKGINTYYYPDNTNPIEFYDHCHSNNFSIYNYTKGYLLNKSFQISTIGDISHEDINNFVSLVTNFIKPKIQKLPLVVLVAGMGTRMNGNFNVPKCLIPIKGISIIERLFINVIECTEFISKLILVVGYEKELITNSVLKLSEKYNIKVEFVENNEYATTNTCKSVLRVKNETGYYLIDGDLVFNKDILKHICVFPDSCCAISRPDPLLNSVNDDEAVCVKTDKSNKITKIGKKLGESIGESIGLYKLTSNLIKNCKINEMLDIGDPNHYYEDCFQIAISKGFDFNMTAIDFTGYTSVEVDTIEDYNNIISTI